MSRRLIAFLICGLAIVFAFGALTAMRWPSIIMFLSLFFHPDPALGFDAINWRELGILYGAPYFLAALCFYAASVSVANRRKGAVIWYVIGMVSAVPVLWIVDFEPGWWQDPSGPEGLVAGGCLIIAMLGYAVLLLRREGPSRADLETREADEGVTLSQAQFEALMARTHPQETQEAAPEAQPRRRRPVPAAIARQRAHFAAEGRRMQARRRRGG
ncbi:hypothetical protein [Henriciella sp.]|uniref:hypothetical protein n=1 Tax=Henriciella sp. TaxID=1968823 RepID=UPI00261C5A2D|nr:hypothetical protein [Henriciella sp.]